MPTNFDQTILLVSHTSFPGGAERSLLELARALLARGEFRPVIACPETGDLPRRAAAQGIAVLPYNAPRVEGRSRLAVAAQGLCSAEGVWTLRRHIARTGARLLHANGLKAFTLGLAASRWSGIPCIFHVRDYPRHAHFLRGLLPRADATVTPTEFLAGALREALQRPDLPVSVVPNPVAPLPAGPGAAAHFRAEWGIDPQARVVTMIAQTVPWKRHDLFLEAAAALCTVRRDLHFVLAGSNPWNAVVPRVVPPALKDRITDAGQRDDIGAVLAASDVLVLPSDHEPFGRVIVEAWWAGVPVVVSDCGGPAELVRHGLTGLHFAHGDALSLASAVDKLLADAQLCRQLAQNAHRDAARYLPDTHAGAIETLYRSLLA